MPWESAFVTHEPLGRADGSGTVQTSRTSKDTGSLLEVGRTLSYF